MIAYTTAEAIDAALTVGDIINRYDPQNRIVPRDHGRIPCPFHHGEHLNLSYIAHKWTCFTCGAKGNAISFVQQMFGLDFASAAEKINEDFGLGLDLHKKLTAEEKYRIYRRQRDENKKRREERQKELERVDRLYELQERIYNAKRDIRQYKPVRGDTALDPRYVQAIGEIERLKYEYYNMDW